jgi:hypothetical protein
MTHGTHLGTLAVAAPRAPASLVFGAQALHARGAAEVPALAFRLTREAIEARPQAHARGKLHAMRGPQSCRHSSRKARCGTPAWLALAGAACLNRSIHTDTQVLPAASRPRLMGAGDFQR